MNDESNDAITSLERQIDLLNQQVQYLAGLLNCEKCKQCRGAGEEWYYGSRSMCYSCNGIGLRKVKDDGR